MNRCCRLKNTTSTSARMQEAVTFVVASLFRHWFHERYFAVILYVVCVERGNKTTTMDYDA